MKKIITGHQPVYLPWLGLFHKISLADIFIFMDDAQYLIGDWNNRNKIKTPQGWMWLTVPVSLKKGSYQKINEIIIDNSKRGTKNDWQVKHWKSIECNYKRAKYFDKYADFFYDMYLQKQWDKLVALNEYQLKYFLEIFDIKIDFYKSSELNFTQSKSDLILEHCKRFNADTCVVGCLGKDYIIEQDFIKNNIKLIFQNYIHPQYNQLWGNFISHLSVIDLLFNEGDNSKKIIMSNNLMFGGKNELG